MSWKVDWWKVRRLREEAKLPTKAKEGDLGWDLYYCPEDPEDSTPKLHIIEESAMLALPTGLAMAFPPEWGFVLWGKSGKALHFQWQILAGCVDSGFRGELVVLMKVPLMHYKQIAYGNPVADSTVHVPVSGEKIAQGLFLPNPVATPTEVRELPESERGVGGFGSTGTGLEAPLTVFDALLQGNCPGGGTLADGGNVCPECGMFVGVTAGGRLCIHPRSDKR